MVSWSALVTFVFCLAGEHEEAIDGCSAEILHLWRFKYDDVPVCRPLYDNVDLHTLHAANTMSLPLLSTTIPKFFQTSDRDSGIDRMIYVPDRNDFVTCIAVILASAIVIVTPYKYLYCTQTLRKMVIIYNLSP